MTNSVKVNTPKDMQLSRTTFKFQRNLIANTMQLHKSESENKISSSQIVNSRLEYGKTYLGTFNEMQDLCVKALARNKSKKIEMKGLVAKLSKKSIKKTKNASFFEENTISA